MRSQEGCGTLTRRIRASLRGSGARSGHGHSARCQSAVQTHCPQPAARAAAAFAQPRFDDPQQDLQHRAERLGIALQQAEWVLRAGYGFAQGQIHKSFLDLLGLATLHTDAPDRVRQALDWYAAGLDFADALHLAFSHSADRFATFDDKLIKRASRIDGVTVAAP
jgi:hypothetical protein